MGGPPHCDYEKMSLRRNAPGLFCPDSARGEGYHVEALAAGRPPGGGWHRDDKLLQPYFPRYASIQDAPPPQKSHALMPLSKHSG